MCLILNKKGRKKEYNWKGEGGHAALVVEVRTLALTPPAVAGQAWLPLPLPRRRHGLSPVPWRHPLRSFLLPLLPHTNHSLPSGQS